MHLFNSSTLDLYFVLTHLKVHVFINNESTGRKLNWTRRGTARPTGLHVFVKLTTFFIQTANELSFFYIDRQIANLHYVFKFGS